MTNDRLSFFQRWTESERVRLDREVSTYVLSIYRPRNILTNARNTLTIPCIKMSLFF